MRRVLAPLLFLTAARWAVGQGASVKLEFGSESPREVYVAKAGELDSATLELATTSKAAEFEIADPKDKLVVVLDTGSGDCFAKPAPLVLKDKGWKLGPKDQRRAGTVEVIVNRGDDPLEEGFVRLSVLGEVRERLLSVGDKGKATFRFVPAGPGEVTVRYRGADGDDAAESKKISVVPGADAAAFTVSLTKAPASSPEDPSQPPPRAPRPSIWGRVVGIVIGLAVIAGALWGIVYFLKKNREQVEKSLTSAGIIPTDMEPTDTGPAPSIPEQRQKIQIVMDDPGPVSAPGPVGQGHVPNPRLVAADGSVFLLAGETKSVGRDAGAGIALAAESSVSRSHARLVPEGDGYTVEDLGSSNGTFVNGVRLAAPTRLQRGDTVQFAGVRFTYEE